MAARRSEYVTIIQETETIKPGGRGIIGRSELKAWGSTYLATLPTSKKLQRQSLLHCPRRGGGRITTFGKGRMSITMYEKTKGIVLVSGLALIG